MCQVSAYIDQEGSEELFRENVTRLELLEEGLRLQTLFEGGLEIPDMRLKSIDFSAGKVILEKGRS